MDGAVALAEQLFDVTGISRDDIDVAMIYDAFTPMLFMQLEGLGFCKPVRPRASCRRPLRTGGSLPCNTNGGLIGEGYIHGLNLTTEAVRQLRGTAPTRSTGARTALVSASRTGVILRKR